MLSISRKDLYEKLWNIGITKTATELNVPYNKLKNACTSNDIPLPTASYWSSLYMGNEKPVQPALPNPNDNRMIALAKAKKKNAPAPKKVIKTVNDEKPNSISTETNVTSLIKKIEKPTYFSYLGTEQQNLTDIYNALKVNKNLSSKPHREIVKYRKKTQSYREDRLRIHSASGEIIPEILPFIDSLFKALEKAGAKIVSKYDETEVLYKKYTFTLNFKLPCKKIMLSPDDKNYSDYHTFEYGTTGKINVEVGYKVYWYKWGRYEKLIKQTKTTTTTLEDLLRRVFLYIFSLPEIIDEKERDYIIAEEKKLKEEQERELIRERREREYKRTQDLLNNSVNYFYSKLIKEYISAELDETTDGYVWAMKKAKWIQDSNKYQDDILREEDKEMLLNRKQMYK
ncbi:hypothetical protein [Oceanobacillus sp. J11TS1]|uniref:hypothetical protein n=1 Tax=Oceanobacillus sp. J11TS1 TaxID=2807191 RepID=UPI001B070FE0|nr:hypothetical protein [Oceanobacillus sp. J11TS1]GIO22306.1 hypothetical protein J11TS1_08870 [Oceanobacillus sp. J11TS1]